MTKSNDDDKSKNSAKPIPHRPVEWEYGYFWMLKELRNTDDKPILANNHVLIPENKARILPPLTVTSLAFNQDVHFPDYLIESNRSKDPAAQCTILALSCRQYGFSLIPSWIEPIHQQFGKHNPRVQTVVINMSEGGWLFRAMSPLLKWLISKNTNDQERNTTYLCYGQEAAVHNFQIKLGCHNVMTCYLFLLDGLGRVRWAGSGPPQQQELDSLLMKHIPQLLPKKLGVPNKGK